MNKVIYDQDGLGERDHNLYGLLVLLQAPGVELVGLTTVSGREWSPRQTPRALDILHRLDRGSEVAVAPGAVFPILNTPARTARWEQVHGPSSMRCVSTSTPTIPPPTSTPSGSPLLTPTARPAAGLTPEPARQHPGEISIRGDRPALVSSVAKLRGFTT